MDQIWDNAQPSRMQLVGVAAMMEQLVYDKIQAAAAGLVNKPEDWPGFSFRWDMWRPGCVVCIYLPEFYFDKRYHEPYYDVDFRPQKELLRFFGGDINRLIYVT